METPVPSPAPPIVHFDALAAARRESAKLARDAATARAEASAARGKRLEAEAALETLRADLERAKADVERAETARAKAEAKASEATEALEVERRSRTDAGRHDRDDAGARARPPAAPRRRGRKSAAERDPGEETRILPPTDPPADPPNALTTEIAPSPSSNPLANELERMQRAIDDLRRRVDAGAPRGSRRRESAGRAAVADVRVEPVDLGSDASDVEAGEVERGGSDRSGAAGVGESDAQSGESGGADETLAAVATRVRREPPGAQLAGRVRGGGRGGRGGRSSAAAGSSGFDRAAASDRARDALAAYLSRPGAARPAAAAAVAAGWAADAREGLVPAEVLARAFRDEVLRLPHDPRPPTVRGAAGIPARDRHADACAAAWFGATLSGTAADDSNPPPGDDGAPLARAFGPNAARAAVALSALAAAGREADLAGIVALVASELDASVAAACGGGDPRGEWATLPGAMPKRGVGRPKKTKPGGTTGDVAVVAPWVNPTASPAAAHRAGALASCAAAAAFATAARRIAGDERGAFETRAFVLDVLLTAHVSGETKFGDAAADAALAAWPAAFPSLAAPALASAKRLPAAAWTSAPGLADGDGAGGLGSASPRVKQRVANLASERETLAAASEGDERAPGGGSDGAARGRKRAGEGDGGGWKRTRGNETWDGREVPAGTVVEEV